MLAWYLPPHGIMKSEVPTTVVLAQLVVKVSSSNGLFKHFTVKTVLLLAKLVLNAN